MNMKKLKVEVGKDVYRDVTYAVEQIKGGARVQMTYAGANVGPFELWHPLVVDTDERAKDIVQWWAVLLYHQENKKK
jgi:hypothetical protein